METLPLAVVYVLGMAMALLQAQRLPRVAAAAGGGFGGLLLILLVRPVIGNLVFSALAPHGQSLSVALSLVNFVFGMLSAIAIGAVAFAIFVDRPEVHLPFPGQKPGGQQPWNPGR